MREDTSWPAQDPVLKTPADRPRLSIVPNLVRGLVPSARTSLGRDITYVHLARASSILPYSRRLLAQGRGWLWKNTLDGLASHCALIPALDGRKPQPAAAPHSDRGAIQPPSPYRQSSRHDITISMSRPASLSQPSGQAEENLHENAQDRRDQRQGFADLQ